MQNSNKIAPVPSSEYICNVRSHPYLFLLSLIDWLLFKVPWAVYQVFSRREIAYKHQILHGIKDHIDGVMVCVLVLSAVDHELEPRSGWRLWKWYVLLLRKGRNIKRKEQGPLILESGLLFRWALALSNKHKADMIIISSNALCSLPDIAVKLTIWR